MVTPLRSACLVVALLPLALGAAYASTTTPTTNCDAGLRLTYDVEYDSLLQAYRISGVELAGLRGCRGSTLRIDIAGRAKTLATVAHAITRAEGRSGRAAVPVGGHVAAGALSRVSVAITSQRIVSGRAPRDPIGEWR